MSGTIFGPDDGDQAAPGICRQCFEWRQYPGGQSHFGWTWWRTCSQGCPHEHHATEVWMA